MNDEVMDNNYFEVGLGLEYGISENFVVSGGYLMGHTGVTEDYQSDLSYSLNSSTFGLGVGINITDNLMLNLGGAYTLYQDGTKTGNQSLKRCSPIPTSDKEQPYLWHRPRYKFLRSSSLLIKNRRQTGGFFERIGY